MPRPASPRIRWTAYLWPDGDVTWRAWNRQRRVGTLHRQPSGKWCALRDQGTSYSEPMSLRDAALWLMGDPL